MEAMEATVHSSHITDDFKDDNKKRKNFKLYFRIKDFNNQIFTF